RIPNANGNVLIENWVEERATTHLDHEPVYQTNVSTNKPARGKKDSHIGLLTQDFSSAMDNETTYREYYNKFGPFEKKDQGARSRLMESKITREVVRELNARQQEKERLQTEERNKINSEYREQFHREFESKCPPTTQPHDLYQEMPVSFWTEHRRTAPGVSQLKTFGSPFHKNASFSTPVELSFESAKPNDMENYPSFAQKSLNDVKIC
ncbi:unnamed protein product, partial [Didymodactylos carnosus]